MISRAFLLFITVVVAAGCQSTRTYRSSSVVDFLYSDRKNPVVPTEVPRLSLPLKVGIAFTPAGFNRSVALGLLFIGLAIITLLGANWDEIARSVRMGGLIGLTFCTQAVAVHQLAQGHANRAGRVGSLAEDISLLNEFSRGGNNSLCNLSGLLQRKVQVIQYLAA